MQRSGQRQNGSYLNLDFLISDISGSSHGSALAALRRRRRQPILRSSEKPFATAGYLLSSGECAKLTTLRCDGDCFRRSILSRKACSANGRCMSGRLLPNGLNRSQTSISIESGSRSFIFGLFVPLKRPQAASQISDIACDDATKRRPTIDVREENEPQAVFVAEPQQQFARKTKPEIKRFRLLIGSSPRVVYARMFIDAPGVRRHRSAIAPKSLDVREASRIEAHPRVQYKRVAGSLR